MLTIIIAGMIIKVITMQFLEKCNKQRQTTALNASLSNNRVLKSKWQASQEKATDIMNS